MGLYGGWCSCILYTVVYISAMNYVKCLNSSITVMSSSLPSMGNSISTNSLNMASPLDTSVEPSAIDVATSDSDVSVFGTQFIPQSSSNIIALTPSIVATTASPVNDPSQDFTSALGASYTTMPSPPSITPSQTLPAMSSNASKQDLSTLNQLNSTLTLSSTEKVNMPSTTTVSPSSANSNTVVDTSAVLSSSPVQTSNIAPSSSSVGGSAGSDLQPSHTSSEQSAIMGSMLQSLTPSSTSTEMSSAPSNGTVMTTDLDMATHLSDSLLPSQTDASATSSTTSTSEILSTPSSASLFSSQSLPLTSNMVSASTTTTHIGWTSSIVPTTTATATTSSSVNTTTTTTTTTAPTTTIGPEREETISPSNVFQVQTDFSMNNCQLFDTDEKLRQHILDKAISKIRDVVVERNDCRSNASSGRRRKRQVKTAITKLHVTYDPDYNQFIGEVIKEFKNDPNMTLSDSQKFNSTVTNTFGDLCNSDVCDKYHGYECENTSSNTTVKCVSLCKEETCSDHGTCNVIVNDGSNFIKQCICETEGYYKYKGENCENREMTWELAVAIAGGTAGGIILILIFALALCGCCKCKDDQYKYRRDSYEQMYERGNKPAYYRNDGPKTHQTGFNNFGYDDDLRGDREMSTNGTTWNPDDSKDTYEKIGRMSQQLGPESSFQIKRPQIAGSRQSTLNEATNEGEDGLLEMSHRL